MPRSTNSAIEDLANRIGSEMQMQREAHGEFYCAYMAKLDEILEAVRKGD